ncbi:MAG: hypothetical protein KAH32_00290 [Chlamydiia bacterium]|nr:hypothetical protein [Chlamydiia bacterium]
MTVQTPLESTVTLQDVQDLQGTTKLITHAEEQKFYKYVDVKKYPGTDGGRANFYLYFRDEKLKKYSISLSELRNCAVSKEGKELDFGMFLEERLKDKSSIFPTGFGVLTVIKHEEEDEAFPLAYYEGYSQDSWAKFRKKKLKKNVPNAEIRKAYLEGRELKARFLGKPFLKKLIFEAVG